MNQDIDFVITWVDGNDKEWLKQKNLYKGVSGNSDDRQSRYREWDNLRFWFRGIEENAPWVRKIHFVTCGHLPSWLNTQNPKLNIVRHSDYIPKAYLPTFCSRPIDMNFHRINSLAEQFVYFNDDMFLLNDVKKTDFFKNGLPCDCGILNVGGAGISGTQKKKRDNAANTYIAPAYDMAVISTYFNKKEVIKGNITNWLNPKYGRFNLRTLMMLPFPNIHGFYNFHIPYSYLKSTYRYLWDVEFDALNDTCMHKFRKSNDLNHYIFTYYQLASNKFYPRRINFGEKLNIADDNSKNKRIYNIIRKKKKKILCLNDTVYDERSFEKIQTDLNNAFLECFPRKSSFEV